MRATTYTTAALLALSLAACNNGEITPTPDTRVALQVTSGIQTRAYDATWEAGDEIGIFGFTQGDAPAQTHANAQYVTTNGNGSFIPAQEMNTIYLPADNTPLDFVAYYPYTAGLKNNIYTVDVTDQSDQSAIDLMVADWESADRISSKVSFNFVHKLSKIVINLAPGMGVTGDELEGMTVQLTGQKTAATLVRNPDSESQCRRYFRRRHPPAERELRRHDAPSETGRRRLLQLDFEQLPRSHAIQGGTQIHLQHHREPHQSGRNLHHHRLDTRQRRGRGERRCLLNDLI